MAAPHSYLVEQGATFQSDMTWKDSDGVVVDITNYILRMQVRTTKGSSTTILDLTQANGGITILVGASGTFRVLVTATQTAALDSDFSGVYDIEAESPAGFVTRLMEGDFIVSAEVTR